MFFANEKREEVRDENPGISFGMYHIINITETVSADGARLL